MDDSTVFGSGDEVADQTADERAADADENDFPKRKMLRTRHEEFCDVADDSSKDDGPDNMDHMSFCFEFPFRFEEDRAHHLR